MRLLAFYEREASRQGLISFPAAGPAFPPLLTAPVQAGIAGTGWCQALRVTAPWERSCVFCILKMFYILTVAPL